MFSMVYYTFPQSLTAQFLYSIVPIAYCIVPFSKIYGLTVFNFVRKNRSINFSIEKLILIENPILTAISIDADSVY